MLSNAMEGRRVLNVPEKTVTKVYGSMSLALREGTWVSNFQKKALRST